MPHDKLSGPYLEAVRRGFGLARELDQRCGPVHLLVGVAEGDGPAAAALDPGLGRSLRDFAAPDIGAPDIGAPDAGAPADDVGRPPYGGLGHVHMQAQAAAMALAESRGEQVGAEHLLIALLDQGTAPVLGALSRAGLDPGTVRRAATTAIGAPGLPAADRAPRAHARGHPGPRAAAGLRAGRPRLGRAPLATGPPARRQAAPPLRPRGAGASGGERGVAGRRSPRPRR
jgi:hypothetical protein